ncbi:MULTISPECIES: exonuclease domain-containing protein [Nocardia]|uniref:exonuclease domain-containing protein n=1 Tax=Nocardia TaxID=1817 RepID=UPI000D697E5C|nr:MULTISPECIES: exonuclease domain-containing protein [Nocardia]
MTSWTELPLAGFDLETTGISIFSDRLVTASVLRIDGADVRAFNRIADPGIPIPPEATKVHGIDDAYVAKHGRPHADVVREVVNELYACWDEGRAIAAFNGCFDFSMLATHAPDFEVRGLIVDGHILDKRFDKYRPGSRKLSAVMIHYGMRLDDAHDAEADALAATRLAWKLPRQFPALAALTAPDLMQAQAAWYREQAESFRDYLHRKGEPTDGIRLEWPIQRAAESTAA